MTATAEMALAGAEAPRAPRRRLVPSRLGPVLWFIALIVLGCLAWEGYKALGQATGDRVLGIGLPVATDDTSLPHLTTIIRSLFEPVNAVSGELLIVNLLGESLVTLQESIVGLLAASVLGMGLAFAFLRLKWLSHAFLPWVVASQTIPLVAIAPMIVIWGGQAKLPGWVAVAAISMYLAFFPMTVNTLRGLASTGATELELMRSLGAGESKTLRYLRLPNALPQVFVGLRLAATASVVGAIVGELSAGTGHGIGRAIMNFSYYYSIAPEKLYASVLVASLTGMALVGVLWLIEHLTLRNRREHA